MLDKLLRLLLISAAAVVILAAGYCFGKSHQTVVFIDMNKAITQPAKMLAKSRLSPKRQQALLASYSSKLSGVISDYGKTHHVTVVAGSVLYKSNDSDITNRVITQTLERIQYG